MAQSQSTGAGGAFYLPQRLVVQLGITQETPEGGVIVMEPGWYDGSNLDERALTNPVVRGLIPADAGQAGRNTAQAELNRKIAIGEATQFDMDKLLQEHAQAQNQQRQQETEAWNAKAQTAFDKGMAFDEPHPDPAVNYARWITSATPQYTAAGGMQSKIMETSPPPGGQTPNPPPPRPQVQRPAPTA